MRFKSLINPLLICLVLLVAAASCAKSEQAKDTLSVEPSAALSFKSAENTDVTLAVSTTADSWDFSAPEWLDTERAGETLVVKVTDNTAERSRVGRIVFTAGTADPVRINVHQAGLVPEDEWTEDSENGVAVTLNNDEDKYVFSTSATSLSVSVSVSIEAAAEEDIVVEIALDPEYAREYAFIRNVSCTAVPDDAVAFASTELTIPAGETRSDPVELTIAVSALAFGENHLVPVLASVKSGEAFFAKDAKRVNYVLTRKSAKEGKVRNALFFEVNDTNPLNALEYLLDDGKDTPFFDLVVLFAANINYNADGDYVYLHTNPNVLALLEESETYIQPLRKKGIKVQLGLLGNHTPAGICQLSDWGAREFAREVAEACRKYKLDGVNLDDEYSQPPIIGNQWFTHSSSAAAARLAYELKMAMKEECYWPTEVSIFAYGQISDLPTIKENGAVIDQTQFVDQIFPNYFGAGYPMGNNMGLDRCAGFSVELNLQQNMLNSSLIPKEVADKGYGWAMWFAFDPSGSSSVQNNRERSMQQFNYASNGFYDCSLKEPQYVYNKLGEGQYDPTPYPINN